MDYLITRFGVSMCNAFSRFRLLLDIVRSIRYNMTKSTKEGSLDGIPVSGSS